MLRFLNASLAVAVLGTASLALTPPVVADEPAPKLELVLDASGSMSERTGDGQTKIEAARTALKDVVAGLPDEAEVGMRVYGGSVNASTDTPQACSDSQQVVPIATANRDALNTAIDAYAPLGQTPTAHALTEAAKDLGPTGQRSIILVSDGEATCSDPCEVARDIAKKGIDLKVDVIGFDVSGTARTQMQCIADAAGGQYYDAKNADQLSDALSAARNAALTPFQPQGKKVSGTADLLRAPALAAGDYVDTLPAADQTRYYTLRRTIPGSTMWVGLSAQMERGVLSSMGAKLLTGSGVDTCSSRNVTKEQFATLLIASYSSYQDECATGDLKMAVTGDPDEPGQLMQIRVFEEPPLAGKPDSANTDKVVWQQMPPLSSPTPVAGAATFSGAPALEPGTYSFPLAAESVQIVKVRLGWGQRLQAAATVSPQPGLSSVFTRFDIDVISPFGGVASDISPEDTPRTSSTVTSQHSALVVATSRPVDTRNRTNLTSWVQSNSLPGDYYVVVSRAKTLSDSDSQVAVPVTLQLERIGAEQAAPTYAAPSASTSAEPSATPSTVPSDSASAPASDSAGDGGTDESTQLSSAASEDGENWTLIGILGGLAAVLLGAGSWAAIALRRRGSTH